MFRNDLNTGAGADRKQTLRFTDVTKEVGLDVTFYGMGVASGDYDNDGDTDVFFTAVGKNRLFRNDSGKFVDVTGDAGVGGVESQWSTGAGWFSCSLSRWDARRMCVSPEELP